MKVAMVSAVFPNSEQPTLGTFCLERMRSLSRIAEVRVIAPVPYWPALKPFRVIGRYSRFSRVASHEIVEGVRVYHPRRLVIPKIWDFTSALFYQATLLRTLRRLRSEFPFDVIDAHFVWPDGYAAMQAGKDLGVPVCVTAHGTDINLMPTKRSVRPMIARTVREVARVVAVSDSLARIVRDLGAEEDRVRVIPNGVDVAKFRRIDRAAARRFLGLEPTTTQLLTIGALIPRKGHKYLIDAVAKLVHRGGHDNLRLIIIGSGELRKKLEARIAERSMQGHVRLAGSVPHDELFRWISASNLFCLSSLREGWPTVFFESWACGVPVVATAVNGAPEAICSERYGLLIGGVDADLVANTIARALQMEFDPDELIKYAAENTWDKVQALHYQELESVVEGYRRGG